MFEQLVSEFVQKSIELGIPLEECQSHLRREFIVQMLRSNNFNQCIVARKIGMHRNTISRHLDELNIDIRQLRKQPTSERTDYALRIKTS